jgi:hypothetical protein
VLVPEEWACDQAMAMFELRFDYDIEPDRDRDNG